MTRKIIYARDLHDEDPDPAKWPWHVRLHSELPGHMVGRNFEKLADALECLKGNPGARLLRHLEGDSWARLAHEGFYYVPSTAKAEATP